MISRKPKESHYRAGRITRKRAHHYGHCWTCLGPNAQSLLSRSFGREEKCAGRPGKQIIRCEVNGEEGHVANHATNEAEASPNSAQPIENMVDVTGIEPVPAK
jgi:hypothetical protein